MKMFISCLAVLVCGLHAWEARSDIGLDLIEADHPNAIYTTLGYDYSILTLGLGYARTQRLDSVRRHLTLFGDLSLPMFQPDFNDFRVRIGPRIDAFRHKWFALPVTLSLVLVGTDSDVVRGLGIATELGTMPGVYAAKWFIAGELFWIQTWSSHLRHTDRYREKVYDDVKDGWYRTPAVVGRFGGRVGGIAFGRVEMLLRGGYEQHGKYNKLVPRFYAIFSTNVRF